MSQENVSQETSPTNSVEEPILQKDLQDIIEEHKREDVPHEEHPEPTAASMADFEQFLHQLKSFSEPERKLELAIEFMQQRLAQTGVPHFKEFWDARRVCLDLFKENINPSVRVSLWAKYSELCRQARRLKEIFDEQSAFAAEQIEMAVAAIEAEVATLPELLAKMPEVEFANQSYTLQENLPEYKKIQRELNLLNAYASKTSGLRKELIKTEMRIRQKNKFFERLSKLGDSIFPRRKELIGKISERFTNDVERFIQDTFSTELKTVELFDARDEIKALQGIAKVLTLNTEAFSQTRQRLSECWDSIKNVVRERRKMVSEQKASYKKHRDEFMQRLDSLKTRFEAGELTTKAVDEEIETIVLDMRKTSLGKMEIRELRDTIRDLRNLHAAKVQTEETQMRQVAEKKENEKQAKQRQLKDSIQELISRSKNMEEGELESALEPLAKEVSQLSLTRQVKQELERQIRILRDAVNEKREQNLLALSDDDRQAIEKLKGLLKERKVHRQEIKTQLETWRKESGSSGLDFSQAMQYNELIAQEKMRLEKIESGIEEIEEKIEKLQGRA